MSGKSYRLVPSLSRQKIVNEYAKDGGQALFTRMHCVLIANF